MASISGYVDNAAQAPRTPTALATHLDYLRGLNKTLHEALERSMRCADRLLGSEPAKLADATSSGTKVAVEPPMVRLLEDTAQESARLAAEIHAQLLRLERL